MKTLTTLISTVGTSLEGNLKSPLKFNPRDDQVATCEAIGTAFQRGNLQEVVQLLASLPATAKVCGAEINSVAYLHQSGLVAPDANLFFCHSATDEGRLVGAILKSYYAKRGVPKVDSVEIADLQDQDSERFRTRGLRNLAREICRLISNYGASQVGINATGGYKAQIAIGVLLGQAVGVPVYYKHERFDDIISFPPMPVALDFDLWMANSHLFFELAESQTVPALDFEDDRDSRLESMIEREEIDGTEYLDLNPTGIIFHETFASRFDATGADFLPPLVPTGEKRAARVEDSGHFPAEAKAFMQKVIDEIPQVTTCGSFYHNPDLPRKTLFRRGKDGVEGHYSNGTFTVKFRVESRATHQRQELALVASLNRWLLKAR